MNEDINNRMISVSDGTIYTYEGASNISIAIAQGALKFLENQSPTRTATTKADALETFGYILGSTGGIMSTVRPNSGQAVKTISFTNNTPYIIGVHTAGGAGFRSGYISGMFNTLSPGDNGQIKYSINHANSMNDIDLALWLIAMDYEKDSYIRFRLQFSPIGDSRHGLKQVNFTDSADIILDRGDFNTTVTGLSVLGNGEKPSFSIASLVQKQSSSDFCVNFLPFAI
ncbi:hypothetical protein VOA_000252 [Vibrio sp. RC586]|uniref:hypothetical protein n=1 Tax=Vibrio sp. RC586 TaxID=675815 RepID=UPI0001BB83A7|nr:hypothetical protein [Vibrio sp. RC586]EEZ00200.1 hypothetical protein VOA_000252 [Vibrio sp. RC586]